MTPPGGAAGTAGPDYRRPLPTAEELLVGIDRALQARDMRAVAAMLQVLAVQSPHDAQAIVDVLAIAKAVSR